MTRKSLLFVDDELINLLAFKAQFRREYDVHCTDDAEEALRILDATPLTCVFSDQRMPDITGTELLSSMQERHPRVLRAIISGFIEDAAIQDALQEGVVDAVFEKPYRAGELISFIERNGYASHNA